MNPEARESEIPLKRTSLLEMFRKKDILKNFEKFTGKYLRWSLFFNKVADLELYYCNFIKSETPTEMFSSEFCKTFSKIFLYSTSGRLLLLLSVLYSSSEKRVFLPPLRTSSSSFHELISLSTLNSKCALP